MCQRHQDASSLIGQFADHLYPTAQELLDRAASSHGGLKALDIEQQLIGLFMLVQEQVVQLMKYDTKLILPTLEPIVKQQATEQGINILEINVLLKNRAEKITDLTERALDIYAQLPSDVQTANHAIFDFLVYVQQSLLVAYADRYAYFEEWTRSCPCMKKWAGTQPESTKEGE